MVVMNVAYYFQMSDKIVDTIDNPKKNFYAHYNYK